MISSELISINQNVKISSVSSQISTFTPGLKILLANDKSLLINNKQPPNESTFIVSYQVSSITLPDTSNFKNECFKIYILNNSSSININVFNNDINNSVTFNTGKYGTNGNFILNNRGILELMWKNDGWLVMSNKGFNIGE